MIHARADYMHIQDNTGKVGTDEPVFLLRAKDKLAPNVLEDWATRLANIHGDEVAIEAAYRHAHLMREWQEKNGCKAPDAPRLTEQGYLNVKPGR